MEQDHKVITVERPTGPRITAEEPKSLGQLVSVRTRTVSKSIVATAVTASAAAVAVLTRHKFATAIGASAITAVATHFVVAVMLMGIIGGGGSVTTPTYTGPGDIIANPQVYHGLRCYKNGYSGNVADIIDTATQLIGTRLQCDGAGNVVALVSSSACTFLVSGTGCSALNVTCASTCAAVTVYDQLGSVNCTGSCDITRATNSARPIYVTNCIGSRPCLTVDSASSQWMQSTGKVTTSTDPFTMASVVERTGNLTTFSTFYGTADVVVGLASTTSGRSMCYAGTILDAPVTDNAFHALGCLFVSGSGGKFFVDNTGPTTGATGTANLTTTELQIGGFNGGSTGAFTEGMAWSGDQSANLGALASNQCTYWGFTSC